MKKKEIIKFLPNSELMKVLDFNFYYLTPVDEEEVQQEKIQIKCSILKAMEYYCRSPHADLFSAHCGNCKIFIDGHGGNAAAYLYLKGPEFIVAYTKGLQFEDDPNPIPVMGVDVHHGNLSLSPTFTIQKY